jgi:hypothetical protein
MISEMHLIESRAAGSRPRKYSMCPQPSKQFQRLTQSRPTSLVPAGVSLLCRLVKHEAPTHAVSHISHIQTFMFVVPFDPEEQAGSRSSPPRPSCFVPSIIVPQSDFKYHPCPMISQNMQQNISDDRLLSLTQNDQII